MIGHECDRKAESPHLKRNSIPFAGQSGCHPRTPSFTPFWSLVVPALLKDKLAVYELIHMKNNHGAALGTSLPDRLTELARRLHDLNQGHQDQLLPLVPRHKEQVLGALDGWLSDTAAADPGLVKDQVLKIFRLSETFGKVLIKVCVSQSADTPPSEVDGSHRSLFYPAVNLPRLRQGDQCWRHGQGLDGLWISGRES